MISKRVEKIPPSGIREFFDLVLSKPNIISLGVGEPDFIAPWRVRERAITALEEGFTSYTSNKGLKILRRTIASYLKKKYGLSYNPENEILITVGVSQGLDLALRTIIDPQDKVVVVSPHYVAYPALVELNLGKVVFLETTSQEGFKVNSKELHRILKKEKPKAIILNYPSNPTGVTYSKEELKKIWSVLSKEDVVVISDEIYGEIVYREPHIPLASLKGAKSKVILLNGFSKGWAMTGFRIGYACGPKKIIEGMTKIHSFNMLCAPIISQIAGDEALKCRGEVDAMVKEYRRRRDFIVKELNRIGLATVKPEGAFYCFPSLKKYKMDSLEFAKRLLLEEKVAVVPGKAFGASYQGFIRISYANSLENLKEAIIRIERFLKNCGS
ncbi:MAG TPA: aminotransferase class I/II-fold pyridoxal phosphate-dependent enzyme [Candidatus Omnitrophica bacterium]|nr:aminotransferase class I/II-fold pyridoxal phosphate-dependent enzyme [Candidatus Omnitrophota bacterium]